MPFSWNETAATHRRGFRLPAVPTLALYLATVVLELPVIITRILMTVVAATLVLLIKDHALIGIGNIWELALIPTGWSLLAIITPFGGGWWWRQNMGGREPSERERIAYYDALELITHGGALEPRIPSSWFVVDSPQPDAAVCGHTLMVSRGLLESEYIPAVLAHELGHVSSSDGKLTAALNRLVVHPPPRPNRGEGRERDVVVIGTERMMMSMTIMGACIWLIRRVCRFAKGGLALRLLAPVWGGYWREREYEADLFAASLGQADELADFLEIHALTYDGPVPHIWLTEHTHPPTELRIDRLRKASLNPTAVAPGPEPLKLAPAGPPPAGPDGPSLTEPGPSAKAAMRLAGRTLPRRLGHDHRPSFGEPPDAAA